MSREKYATKILERFDMSDYKPRMTPCEQKLDFMEHMKGFSGSSELLVLFEDSEVCV